MTATTLPDEPAEVRGIRTIQMNNMEASILKYIDALLQSFNAERLRAEAMAKDAGRLDYLDKLNAALNARHGTTYKWRLIFSSNIVRLMRDHSFEVDLNDASPNGADSCRKAIDTAIEQGAQP